MNRRGFLVSCLALGVAPAIVRAESLMPIVARDTALEDAIKRLMLYSAQWWPEPPTTIMVPPKLYKQALQIMANGKVYPILGVNTNLTRDDDWVIVVDDKRMKYLSTGL